VLQGRHGRKRSPSQTSTLLVKAHVETVFKRSLANQFCLARTTSLSLSRSQLCFPVIPYEFGVTPLSPPQLWHPIRGPAKPGRLWPTGCPTPPTSPQWSAPSFTSRNFQNQRLWTLALYKNIRNWPPSFDRFEKIHSRLLSEKEKLQPLLLVSL